MGLTFSIDDDEDAVDAHGKPKKHLAPGFEFDESKRRYVWKLNRPAKVYTWKECVYLAMNSPLKAVHSPENLGNFALAMFLAEWDWHRGYAQPIQRIQ
jgi:hypothetical protein